MGRILALKAGTFAVFAVAVIADPYTTAATPPAAGEPVVAVGTCAGIDRLRRNLELIEMLGDMPGLRSMFEGAVAKLTGGRGLIGIDAARPWGVIYLGSERRSPFLVPCSDFNSLTETLATIDRCRSNDLGDGSFEIQAPGGSYFIRQSGSYALIARTAEDLHDVPANPNQFFDDLHQSYDVAARIYWHAIPAEKRAQMIEQVRTSLGRHLPGRGEWTSAFTKGTAAAAAQLERAIMWLERTDTITLGSRLDEASQKASVDLTWRTTEGRHADRTAGYLRAQPTRFASSTLR